MLTQKVSAVEPVSEPHLCDTDNPTEVNWNSPAAASLMDGKKLHGIMEVLLFWSVAEFVDAWALCLASSAPDKQEATGCQIIIVDLSIKYNTHTLAPPTFQLYK